VPLAALSSGQLFSPFVTAATLNLIPLLSPTNDMTYDAAVFFNSALGLLSGCAAGGLALLLIPPVPTRVRAQRLVDLSIRDLRRLAGGRRRWTRHRWQSRLYARLTALPEEAESIQRSHLVAALSVGLQVIRLRGLSRRGRVGIEISAILASLASGDLPKLRLVLETTDREIASIPEANVAEGGRLRARAALRAIEEAVCRRSEHFLGGLA
jgi:uncharacterized membrane protein YccC